MSACRRPLAWLAALAALAAGAGGCERLGGPGHEEWTPPGGAAVAATLAPREPCLEHDPERRAFFGDLHVHTAYSMDARAWGLPRTPDDAYRYATGGEIELQADREGRVRRLRIDRPLDFAAVTDHAEWMGEVSLCTTPGSDVYATASCRIFRGEESSWLARVLGLRDMAAKMAGIAGFLHRERAVCGEDARRCRRAVAGVWKAERAAAEGWYDRTGACRFTTFPAWEYSRTPGNSMVHRNVVFRNEIVPELPISWIDTPETSGLRRKLRERCTENGSGCDVILIPHNPNLSNGRMFAFEDAGEPLAVQREHARERAALEPLVEMMQIKGESECRNGFAEVVGGPDELCDFEKKRDLPGERFPECGEGTGSGANSMHGCISHLDYVRYALVEGLRLEARLGVNPYRFGLIGSTDDHAAAPGSVAEYDPAAPLERSDLTDRDRLALGEDPLEAAIWANPGGLVGLWAEENSRDSLFDAMRRREAFATSGPRIRPRLFAGWNLPADLCARPDFAAVGYARGVPMGGVLPAVPNGGAAPVLAVAATRDPGTPARPGGRLQRIQIVKGWIGDDAMIHQEVYDVAGDPHNGADVDLATCTPRGPGADRLCSVWRDPDFDPGRGAVYYARVVENPSCRWSTWQCLAWTDGEPPAGCRDPRVPRTIQERAWTSPVWYSPQPAGR